MLLADEIMGQHPRPQHNSVSALHLHGSIKKNNFFKIRINQSICFCSSSRLVNESCVAIVDRTEEDLRHGVIHCWGFVTWRLVFWLMGLFGVKVGQLLKEYDCKFSGNILLYLYYSEALMIFLLIEKPLCLADVRWRIDALPRGRRNLVDHFDQYSRLEDEFFIGDISPPPVQIYRRRVIDRLSGCIGSNSALLVILSLSQQRQLLLATNVTDSTFRNRSKNLL